MIASGGAMSAVPRLQILRDAVSSAGPGEAACDGDGESWLDAAGRCVAVSRTERGRHRLELPGVATFLFEAEGPVRAIACAGIERRAVARAFRHSALPLVLHALGREALHASGVLMREGVVAFCGASGSGKSTLAYALHRRGVSQWADDVVALDVSDARVAAIPMPFEVRLRPASASAFGLGQRFVEIAAEPGPTREPLAAIFVLTRVEDAAVALGSSRLHPAAALAALLPHAFCFTLRDRERKRLMLQRYLVLVREIPVWELRVGGAIEELDVVLDAVEAAVRGRETAIAHKDAAAR